MPSKALERSSASTIFETRLLSVTSSLRDVRFTKPIGLISIFLRATTISQRQFMFFKNNCFFAISSKRGPASIVEVVIPSKATEHFNIKPGDLLLFIGDRKKGGLGLVKASAVKEFVMKMLKGLGELEEET